MEEGKLPACSRSRKKARRERGICSLRAGKRQKKHANGRGHATCVQLEPEGSTQVDESASAACIPSEKE